MKSKRIVIYNPKRFFLFTTILILIFSIIIANIFNLNKSYGQYANKESEYNHYVIKKGDTLWSIVNNHYSNKYDPRELIYQIKNLNELEDNIIYEGDTLKLPNL